MRSRYALIMAGGAGKRFWPLSRSNKPKQMLSIVSEKSMLKLTYDRLAPLFSKDKLFISTNSYLAESVKKELPFISEYSIITEPIIRNTAGCIALAIWKIYSEAPEATLGVFPADHYIKDEEKFRKIISAAYKYLEENDVLLTIGIEPTRAERGFGYLELAGEEFMFEGQKADRIIRFAEKPKDIRMVKRWLKRKSHLWNGGIFIFRLKMIMENYRRFLPNTSRIMDQIFSSSNPQKAKEMLFKDTDFISFDYAIAEKADNIIAFKADVGWNDVGSWSAIYELISPDENGNIFKGEVVAINSSNLLAFSSNGKIIGVIGMKDCIIIDTPDALLVCAKDKAQEVNQLVDRLKELGKENYI